MAGEGVHYLTIYIHMENRCSLYRYMQDHYYNNNPDRQNNANYT